MDLIRTCFLRVRRSKVNHYCSFIGKILLAVFLLGGLLHLFFQKPIQGSRQYVANKPRRSYASEHESLSSFDSLEKHPDAASKTILIWTRFIHDDPSEWRKIFARQIEGKCPYKCEVTQDKKHWTSADAIVFKQITKVKYPPWHPPSQVWVLFSIEAPTHITWEIPNYRRYIFNWTMTYHRDSDVVMPYGQVLPSKNTRESITSGEPRDYWSEKNDEKFAVWMVSKCDTPSKREEYVRQLQRYTRVDIYGGCGTLKCGNRVILPNMSSRSHHDDCYMLLSTYKFYFAFENSICEDYITEKFFKALQMDTIPVVFGGGNYSVVAPSNSFISAMDFPSPKDLARYLQIVADNQTLYNSYFNWKKEHIVELGFPFHPLVCDLCTKLHQQPYYNNTERNSAHKGTNGRYYNVMKWFKSVSKCRSWGS